MFLFVSLLGIAAILFGALQGKKDAAGARDKELESSLQAFMDEFEKENQFLLDSIQRLQSELKHETTVNRERILQLEARIEELSKTARPRKPGKKPETSPAIVFNEHYSRVVMMAREGRTPEQIAKDTGIGMGEIQMILSLVKQGNAV